MCCPQVSLAAQSHPVNRSFSHYITLMATFLWSWTSSQVVIVTLYTHVPTTDQSLVTDTTCSFLTALQASATPSPLVATPTTCPLDTLQLVSPVDFMQDPTNSLLVMLKCSMRKQLKAFIQNCICWLSQLLWLRLGKKKVINWQLLFETLVYYLTVHVYFQIQFQTLTQQKSRIKTTFPPIFGHFQESKKT